MDITVTENISQAAVVPAAGDELQPQTIGEGAPVAARERAVARRDGRGITTIEYVIGIVAGITLVGVLILALTNPAVQHALVALLEHIFGMGNSTKVGTPGK